MESDLDVDEHVCHHVILNVAPIGIAVVSRQSVAVWELLNSCAAQAKEACRCPGTGVTRTFRVRQDKNSPTNGRRVFVTG